ncbi:ParB/RepB/Spo0J family partition protein [Streptomyces sp. TRM 70351]|uniref:ParB/RepB/Spo0J family partition protein n=1 Tax=Streptomyces sp. TRM 70351 TaxID=3116552 RepID=UPI002E7B639F|nr:ParB/RepB/Spo0J family partition protein [Streptomyces sp. TRM 70351]MEE1931204.1 ParB/RepB/Spo0J family partition protein [Streptomyces sp. TRM 70351]
MSIADKVGESSSFGRRKRSERGRAKALAEGVIPAYELVRLDLAQVSPTPLNPRRNFGTDHELARFGEELRQVQLAACVVVTRTAYLRLWPHQEQTISPDAQYVLVNGERRYRSALHVGIDQLDFVVRDDLASSREDFIDHLLAENLDREDFNVIERARGVQQLVDVCAEETGARGARARAAERLNRDRSWVTNQIALLTLPEELQAQLVSGEVSERDGRLLARHLKDNPGLDAASLLEHLSSVKNAVSQQREEQQRLINVGRQVLERHDNGGLLSADNKPAPSQTPLAGTPAGKTPAAGSLSADNEPAEQTAPDASQPAAQSPARPEASVPSQAMEHNGAKPPVDVSPAPPGSAVTALERTAQQATEVAASLRHVTTLHRETAGADREAADKLIEVIREELEAALRQLPAAMQIR